MSSTLYHSFNINIAKEYGIVDAVIFHHISFWCDTNKQKDINFRDEHYWTYSSIKAFLNIFNYLTEKKIRGALNRLEESGLIKKGNYNKIGYDRTTWYAVTEKGWEALIRANVPKGQMDLAKRANGFSQKGEPIPDINTNTNTDNINTLPGMTSSKTKGRCPQEEIVALYHEILPELKTMRIWGKNRQRALNARWKEDKSIQNLDWWRKFFERVRECPWLMGANDRKWRADLEWLLSPSKFIKIREGDYLAK
ncbi:MAG: hypothetical protein GY816_23360 [Cytophagales bacterium]|nr:hypothetical protein [Cytophagales bacterium]